MFKFGVLHIWHIFGHGNCEQIKLGKPKIQCNYQTVTMLVRIADPDYFGKADPDPDCFEDPDPHYFEDPVPHYFEDPDLHSSQELEPDPH
jgi:hypothetical protein